ncbi:F-box protein PP2-A13 [Cocos nucifera]|uniref:F-box protein PP2-A13 n=1 Tax=Cocos nucifera TaxID=13894 RepID=A0A8K0N5R8_COCNU|nr:F-box protein PP2-A13 [Cocos nucifera]
MGAGVSSMDGRERPTGLGDLPESCVAEVLLRLDPPEIGRLAGLSRTFRGAASSDYVWEVKLPRNYRYLMETALGEESSKRGLGKREIFARLCQGNRFDAGKKVKVKSLHLEEVLSLFSDFILDGFGINIQGFQGLMIGGTGTLSLLMNPGNIVVYIPPILNSTLFLAADP